MTTAARATYQGAVAAPGEYGFHTSAGQVSQAYSARDLPGHTQLKFRKSGQSTADDLRDKDLAQELEERETKYEAEKDKKRSPQEIGQELKKLSEGAKPLMLKDKEEIRKTVQKYDDRDDDAGDDGGESDLESSDDDDDDDDDEELLRLELEKIKKEREEERRRKEEEERVEAQRRQEEEINAAALKGNPLLAPQSAQIKRKWNDDVVFKNQSRGEQEKKKRFINDTIRNDFHRSFLAKYMR